MPSDGHELRAVLHEEIGRLPEEYRAPVVLCHLEGMTREIASDRLRCPANMVGVRLMRARERLRPIDFLRNHSMRDGAGSHLDSSWNCLLVADELIRGDRTMALKMGFVRRLPKVINATIRDATHVLAGLLYHESDVRIEEHYTDTGGFTDHVFALCYLLGFRFASRIRDLIDRRLAVIERSTCYPALEGLIGTALNTGQITAHWDEILRLATSIRQGIVTASLMLRKLGSYPR